MSEPIKFTLDGVEVEAGPGETIWQVAKRQGKLIPLRRHGSDHPPPRAASATRTGTSRSKA